MSVKLMSAIFETEFTGLKYGTGNATKARAGRLVLSASDRRANDNDGDDQ